MGHPAVALATEVQDLFEADVGVVIVEVREAAVTTEGDEVQVAFVLVALQTRRHSVIVALY